MKTAERRPPPNRFERDTCRLQPLPQLPTVTHMLHLESHDIDPQHIQLRLTILLTQNHVDRIALPLQTSLF